jgi:hypothetical protein
MIMKTYTNRLKVILCLVVFLGVFVQARAAWNADWIDLSSESQSNSWYCFRKEIEMNESLKTAIAKIACDSKYWLWINQKCF